MEELAPGVIAILKKYVGDPSAFIGCRTSLTELEIDHLDIPMVLLDIADRFEIEIPASEIGVSATVSGLVGVVASHLQVKALPRAPRTLRPKRSWVSTVAEARH